MRFEWDERKNRSNFRKHRISFEVAEEVFHDPFSFTVMDRIVNDDERFWTIGRIESLSILVVVHTMLFEEGDEVVRIISARNASPQERRFYEENEH
jgi:hypothetical protein